MENKIRREFHYFLLTDYEKEEKLLRKRHNEGYQFKKVSLPGFYYFEKCDPEDVIYKLDFNPQSSEDKESYIQMYIDFGWEYIQDMNEYSYFKKAANNIEDNEMDIFSDDESKLEMLKRIFRTKMIPIMIIFFLCGPAQWHSFFTIQSIQPWNISYIVLWGILFLFYLWIIIHCGFGFYRIWKKYSNKID